MPVTVLVTQDEALLVVAASLLQDSGIKHVITNRLFQDLVGYGRIGVSIAAGMIEIRIHPNDAEAATDCLKDLEPAKSSLRMSRAVRWLFVFFMLVLPLIIGIITAIGRLLLNLT